MPRQLDEGPRLIAIALGTLLVTATPTADVLVVEVPGPARAAVQKIAGGIRKELGERAMPNAGVPQYLKSLKCKLTKPACAKKAAAGFSVTWLLRVSAKKTKGGVNTTIELVTAEGEVAQRGQRT